LFDLRQHGASLDRRSVAAAHGPDAGASSSSLEGTRLGASRSDASRAVLSGTRSAGRLKAISFAPVALFFTPTGIAAAFQLRTQQSAVGQRSSMRNALFCFALVAASICSAVIVAEAHPHVWVTMTEELLYTPDGSVTGVRHAWTFDDMFSAFATQGLEQKTKGTFTREELAPLAKVNIESLKEYAYFTYAKVNGKRERDAFAEPVDYWLDYDAKQAVLTLHFTLPFNEPVRAAALDIEVFDPEFFIDFGFAEKDPVRLVSAPTRCRASMEKPHDESFPASLRFDPSLITSEANKGMGASFSNGISVTCP
jgi:ABC-type uncharacterized transport system substrate-binding protein